MNKILSNVAAILVLIGIILGFVVVIRIINSGVYGIYELTALSVVACISGVVFNEISER